MQREEILTKRRLKELAVSDFLRSIFYSLSINVHRVKGTLSKGSIYIDILRIFIRLFPMDE
jgi:hypothetical protein